MMGHRVGRVARAGAGDRWFADRHGEGLRYGGVLR